MRAWPSPARRALLPPSRRPGTLPWMIAATSFLAVIAVSAALGLARTADRLDRAGLGRSTLELVDPDPRRLEIAAAQLLRRATRDAAVATAVRVPPAEIATLLAPSLGPALEGLPLPALIDVTLQPGASDLSLRRLADAHGARLIRAADGWAPLARLVATLRRLAWAIVAMAAGVTILIAILAARLALEAHGPTLATLHALGASDRDLATLVQRRTTRDALAGGLGGFACAALAIRIVGIRFAALDGTAGASLPGAEDWILLAFVPLAFAAGATLATRLAVLATFGRAP